ncbi:MAG: exosortase A [Gammaproteobacteria bacterium]
MRSLAVSIPHTPGRQKLLPGLVLLLALLVLFRDTALAMIAIWARSDTFAHAFLVPFIVVWLVWRRRDALATLEPRPAPWLLLPIGAACLLWLLGELANVAAASQFALVTLIVLSVPALYGLKVGWKLLFPLLFLYFCVPVGEFLVPQLMEWTADFTVRAVRASGIPIYREGLQFVIPSGSWSVVEACSGVRYLIASFMVGTLFAYLTYRSARRRAIFMLVSILVPIVANWLRAYLIVMLGHLSGNQLAAGFDHIIYGWVFFGIVILVMFTVGARWAQHDAAASVVATPAEPSAASAAASRGEAWAIGVGALALSAAAHTALWQLDETRSNQLPIVRLTGMPTDRWTHSAQPLTDWRPGFQRPSAVATGTYAAEGKSVGVWVGYYRRQGSDRKLVSSSNELVEAGANRWAQVSAHPLTVNLNSQSLVVRAAELRASRGLDAAPARRLRVWQVYWVGGSFTASDAQAKLRVAFDRLLGRGDDGAVVLLFTEFDGSGAADATLAAFSRAYLDTLAATLAAVRERH